MKRAFIKTKNYTKMYETMSTLVNLDGNPERMALIYGAFGLGKTFALEKLAAEFDAILLRTDQTWTVKVALKLLSAEMGIDPKGQSSEIMERVIDAMLYSPRPIIIDEIDTLLPSTKFTVLELFRDIHDMTGNAFMMVGMESCDARLKNHSHFYSRVVAKAKFEEIPLTDISQFCKLCGVGDGDAFVPIHIEEDLQKYFLRKYPNLRVIKVLLLRIEKFCDINGYKRVDLNLFKQSGVENADS